MVSYLLLAPMTLYFMVFLAAPLWFVLVDSVSTSVNYGQVIPVWTLQNYRDALKPEYLAVFTRSLGYAALTTMACLFLAYPLAFCIAMYGGRYKSTLLLLVMLPFWTSYLIRVYSWRIILAEKGVLNTLLMATGFLPDPVQFLNTPFAVVMGLTYGFLPFMTLPLYVSLEKVDRTLLEAAGDLGAHPLTTFFKVIFPLTLPGIVAGVVLTFIPAVGDFVTPDLLGGPQTQMIGNIIESKFFPEQNWPHGSALSVILMALLMLGLVFYTRYGSDEERSLG